MNTKRNLIQFCLLAVLLALPMAVQAQVNYAISGSTAYVTSSPNASGYIVIDSTYQGYPSPASGLMRFSTPAWGS
jgi:hypothetical protein